MKRLQHLVAGVLFLCLSCAFQNLMAQDAGKDKISISFKNENLPSIFKRVEKISDYKFVFVYDEIGSYTATGKVENASIKDFLNLVVKDKPITYKIDGNFVNVSRKSVLFERVSGRVIFNDDKEPVVGAVVKVDGTNNLVYTDIDGKYSLSNVPSDKKISVLYMGMEPVSSFPDKIMDFVLKSENITLNDVIVTGYGNTSKSKYTGSVAQVNASEIMLPGVSSIDQMLQGVVPGIFVQQETGMVGASPKIRVRGTSSLLGSQNPVWVVDGVVQRDPQPFNSEDNTKFSVDADDISQLAGNAISWLNPNDIETITVLKDASATAIYGSEAANGVIVITTKRASVGNISVNYSGDFSVGQRPSYSLYNQMNSNELMEFSKQMYEDRVSYPSKILPIGYAGILQSYLNKEITKEQFDAKYAQMANQNTDWFSLLFKNSISHKHNIGISGGTERVQNRTSFGISDENGEAYGNKASVFTASSNTTVNFFDNKLILNLMLNGTWRKAKGYAYGVDPFSYAYNTSRAIPMYNPDGSLYYHERWASEQSSVINGKMSYLYNIKNELDNTGSENNTRTWGSTIDAKWQIIKDLQWQGLISYSSSSSDVKKYATDRSFYISSIRGYDYGAFESSDPNISLSRLPFGGLLYNSFTDVATITVRNALVYDRLFGSAHKVTAQIGIETNSTKTRGTTSERYGYLKYRGETFVDLPLQYFDRYQNENDDNELARGDGLVINRIANKLSEYVSAVYSFDERYIINLNGRLDASSRFGQDKNKRFEPTWSLGAKWRVASEPFAKGCNWMNSFDIIASYGYQGNSVETVSPYLIAQNGGINEYYNDYMLTILSLPYPNLGWEKTKTYNFGVDAGFLNWRLNFSFNYFKKISDVLSSRNVPVENGVINAVVDGGEMTNTGYDFVFNVVPVKTKDFTWQVSLNTSVINNAVNKNQRVNTLNDYLEGSAIVDGESFSTFYSFKFDGLDDNTGFPKFANMDVKGAETPLAYLVRSGKFIPDFSGGLNMMFKYKNWSLYTLFNVQWGGHARLPYLYDTKSNYGIPTPEQNLSRDLLNRWRKTGDNTLIPSIPNSGNYINLPSSLSVESQERRLHEMYNLSDARVANTDFVRCRSLALSYEFNPSVIAKIGAKRLALKATLTNPFIWVSDSKWNGLDPETANWPSRRVASFSVNIMF